MNTIADNSTLNRRIPWRKTAEPDPVLLLTREWLVANGLGGYASMSISGACTRRYHGLLISAFPAPLGRMVMLSHFTEEVELPDETVIDFSSEETSNDKLDLRAAHYLTEFTLEAGLPIWRYEIGEHIIEKRLMMPHLQNTLHVSYRLLSGEGSVRLRLRPSMHFRAIEAPVDDPLTTPYEVKACGDKFEVSAHPNTPSLRFRLQGPHTGFVLDGGTFKPILYRFEQIRGYEYCGTLWSPGYFRTTLHEGQTFTVVASTESWDTVLALNPEEAFKRETERRRRLIEMADPKVRTGWIAELVLAADQFIIKPTSRSADAARAYASGDDVRTIIAGYHWFTDWGRDTMISLEGLTLTTGRHQEAGYILRMFGYHIKDGLIPNMFPERESEGLYHTADATLWYFHALQKYLDATGDRETLRLLLPKLLDVIDHHVRGTRFGIGIDPADGLLRQGADGYQLTWMDAKVGDWVVTPRRGKAVEINALWYNALRLLESWVTEELGERQAVPLQELSARAYESFNERFWFEDGKYLYDVIDGESGDDPALRPNQLMAISLTHPILDPTRWKAVLDVVRDKLLTPAGLRSLAPNHADYKTQYYGDLRARDAAYHQGTVWAWLIGPYIDAWMRVYPHDHGEVRRVLEEFAVHLADACIGSISEIFDGQEPFTPRGCVAQAWSVAEVLRCWTKTS
jgi:predicted glycogen debranching enzyme